MAKKVINAAQVLDLDNKVFIPTPVVDRPVLELEEEYAGPTAEEIEAENRKIREKAEAKAAEIIENAKKQASNIVEDAEKGSFDYIKKATEKAKVVDDESRIEIDKYRIEQEETLQKKIQDQKEALRAEAEETKNRSQEEGYKAGYESGRGEVDRLIDRLHTIIEGSIDKRDTIIEDAENQIVRMVLLITHKIVKAISEEQKGVVISNIRSALDKIKGKTEIIIRVNTEDLELTTEHKDELMQHFEELKHVTILEDTRVDKGGCIIETDFGSVDARIATQLQEVEEKVREMANLSYFDVSKVVEQTKKAQQVAEIIEEDQEVIPESPPEPAPVVQEEAELTSE